MIRKVNVYFGGACEPPQLGAMAFAFAVYVDGVPYHEEVGFEEGSFANGVAEAGYRAIKEAICYLIANAFVADQVRFYGDDMNVVNVMTGRWKPKGRTVNEAIAARRMAESFHDVGFTAVTRAENSHVRNMLVGEFVKEGVEPKF